MIKSTPMRADPAIVGAKPATLLFTKASACGNDFLLIEASVVQGNLHEMTRRLCDRHNGVGADGVEWLYPDDTADVLARLINADGSDAEVSGNGTRCVAAQICARDGKSEIAIRTDAGVKVCRLLARQGSAFEFETNMGQPEISASPAFSQLQPPVSGMRISLGNPHFVIFLDNFPEGWQQQAESIAGQPDFPHGTNVEYVVVRGQNEIDIRLFERGAGETQSSGTGSCAAAVAAISSGRAQSPVTVRAAGGAQFVRWEQDIYLRGPATLVCWGEFFL